MIGSTIRQASLFYFAFAKEVSAIKDVTLDEVDALLQDGELLQLTSEKLGGRRLRSKDFGRPGSTNSPKGANCGWTPRLWKPISTILPTARCWATRFES